MENPIENFWNGVDHKSSLLPTFILSSYSDIWSLGNYWYYFPIIVTIAIQCIIFVHGHKTISILLFSLNRCLITFYSGLIINLLSYLCIFLYISPLSLSLSLNIYYIYTYIYLIFLIKEKCYINSHLLFHS